MRKGIFILISVFLFSCSSEVEKLDYELIFGNKTQEFIFSKSEDFIIKGNQGTLIMIPKKMIEQEFGDFDSISFKLREYYTKSDFIKAGLSTTSNGKLLESKGMIFLQVFLNKEEIELKNIPIHVIFKEFNFEDNYQIFYGNETNESINWNLDTITPNYHIFYNYVLYGKESDYLDQTFNNIIIDSILWTNSYTQIDTIGTFEESNDTLYSFNPDYYGMDQMAVLKKNKFFRVLPFNWANLDIFLKLENLTTVEITSNKINDPHYFCVFQKYNSIIPNYQNTFNGVPVGEIVSIIGVDFVDNKIYFDIQKQVEIKNDMTVKLKLKETEKTEIDSILKELD